MKLSIYKLSNFTPNAEQYEDYCNIFNLPSLKYGYVEILGDKIGVINKSEFKKYTKIAYRVYDNIDKKFIDGFLLFNKNNTESIFVQL